MTNSTIHFTSDTHWGHANVIRHANRPYSSLEDMNESLIYNWNKQVSNRDVVWHLGDFSFQKLPELKATLRRLNGQINLILGNHDDLILKNKEELLKENFFHSIQAYKKLKYEGQKIILLHYGMRVWDGSHHGSWHAFGHSHNSLPPHGKSCDVGVDSTIITNEYRPISFDELKIFMDSRETSIVDHHNKRQ